MVASSWHSQIWAETIDVLREHFTKLGYDVHNNWNAGTITIIDRKTNKCLQIQR